MAGPEVPDADLNVTFRRIFSAAHRLAGDPSKCSNIHGHNYCVEAEISAFGQLDASGFVIPFERVKRIIDNYDHTLILAEDDPLIPILPDSLAVRPLQGPPSTERLAQQLAEELVDVLIRTARLSTGIVRLRLRETEGIEAHASREF